MTTRERPILFSDAMVRAILDGTKTQTRRVIKPAPVEDEAYWGDWVIKTSRATTSLKSIALGKGAYGNKALCPYGVPGDRLWVRECFAYPGEVGDTTEYRTDNPDPRGGRWRPSIHMPRWACRLVLEVTDVRVERLCDISEEDARAEGVEANPYIMGDGTVDDAMSISARANFAALWDSINAARGFGWDANPWVWVVSFRRLDDVAQRGAA